MKKRISLILVFAMLLTMLIPLGITTVSAATAIANQSGLAAISSNLSGSYELSNDITISGTWTGITGFTGTLDGKGHTITIADGATVSGGLFQLLNNGATVKNLNIVQAGSATYTLVKPNGSGAYCFGMVAACLAAGSDFNNTAVTQNASNIITIQNVTATADITFSTTETNLSIGGIAGETGIISTFENCVFNGSITDGVNRTGRDMNTYQTGYGGIVGQAIRTGGPVTIHQCVNNADITGYANEGGILGHSRSWGGGATALKALVITQCVNNGTITCSQTTTGSDKRATAGGIVGYAMVKSADSSYATITNNINYGDVTGAGTGEYAYVAGIFACINVSGTATISGNINYGTLSGGHDSYRNNFYTKKDGSGTINAANNYNNPAADAVPVLNATYPDVYVFKDGQVKLAWLEPEAAADNYVMITDQASFISAIATNSVKDADGKATGKFKLANDITISGAWSFTTIFRGELDGDGHTVTFADGATVDSGLFRVLGANAYIHDLKIEQTGTVTWTLNPDLPGRANACIGGVAGLATAGNVNNVDMMNDEGFISNASNKVRIENVTVTANMNVAGSGNNISVGGIIGEVALYTEITNCEFNGYITDTVEHSGTSNQDGGSKRVGYGGIVGFGIRPAVLVITECINNGDISGYGNEGGIIGTVSPGWNAALTLKTTTIQRCINNGTITCNLTTNAGSAGGIAGYLYGRRSSGATVNVLNNINYGTIAKADGNAYIAGIVARVNRKTNVNVVTLAGNLQLSDDIVGSQIVQQTDGDGDSGVLVFANNYGRGDGNDTYGALPNVAAYSAAYATLNAAYPDVYVFKDSKVKLAWAEPEAEDDDYVMITDQASFVSAIATNSVKDADGKALGKFKLANNITISGSWSFTTIFRGELDGNGHTITFADGATVDSGLFQVLGANAYIHDLKIAQKGTVTWTLNPDLPGRANACIGGVAGLATAGNVNGTNVMNTESFISNAANKVCIENVTVTANMLVTGSGNNISVGGIIGEVAIYTEITNCEFNGYITDTVEHSGTSNQDGGSKRVGYGGIVGFGIRPAVLVITECINNGDISGYGHEGGILGAASPGWDATLALKTTTIQRCINYGTITCNLTTNAGSAGGIAGYLYGRRIAGATVNVLNNINYGTVEKADGNAYTAGIVARVNRKTNVNVLTFAGNLQLSDDIVGSQIVQQTDGDGNAEMVYTNNFGRGDGNDTYGALPDVAAYEAAYATLNAAYPGVYELENNKIKLAWWTEPEEIVDEDYVMITDQASFISEIVTNSTKDNDGKALGRFKLANDITISGTWDFTTIFRGELDGDGHTITFAKGATVYGGLFQALGAKAYIHDLQIVQQKGVTWALKSDVTGAANACLGGVAGVATAGNVNGVDYKNTESFISNAKNKVRIENVTVTANMDVAGETANASVGGIIGEVGLYTEITNCVFNGYIEDSFEHTGDSSTSSQDGNAHAGGSKRSAYGGIVGFGVRPAALVVTECVNNGDISGYGHEGGIVGAVSPGWNAELTLVTTTIQRCINKGTITCYLTTAAGGAGGISAYLYSRRVAGARVNVLNNINYGTVAKDSGDAYIAGLVACVNRKENVNVVTFAGNLQLSDDIGGGSQIVQRTDGSGEEGVLVYTNNFCCGAGTSGTYTPLSSTKSYVDAYLLLDAAYADTFVFRDEKVALKWADTTNLESATAPIGTQLSAIENGKRNIRVVAGTGDGLSADKVGIEILVCYGEIAIPFSGETTTVHSAIYADGSPVTAASQGVDYLYTAVINGAPADATVDLMIRTFHVAGGTTYFSEYSYTSLDLAS